MRTSNIVETVRELISDAILLFRQEMALARAETQEKIIQVQFGILLVAIGLLVALTALLVLVQAVVAALATVVSPPFAALLVGVFLAVVSIVLVLFGARSLKPENLKPEKTIKSLRESGERFKEGR